MKVSKIGLSRNYRARATMKQLTAVQATEINSLILIVIFLSFLSRLWPMRQKGKNNRIKELISCVGKVTACQDIGSQALDNVRSRLFLSFPTRARATGKGEDDPSLTRRLLIESEKKLMNRKTTCIFPSRFSISDSINALSRLGTSLTSFPIFSQAIGRYSQQVNKPRPMTAWEKDGKVPVLFLPSPSHLFLREK